MANIDDQEQDDNCDDCDSPCLFKRPCTHPCPKNQCHPKECKRCIVPVKSKCYCGLTEIYYRCCDVYKKGLSDEEIGGLKQKYLSCGSKCIKTVRKEMQRYSQMLTFSISASLWTFLYKSLSSRTMSFDLQEENENFLQVSAEKDRIRL